jgi:hypothetical protein
MRNNSESDSTLMSERYRAHISVEVDRKGRRSGARSWRPTVVPVGSPSAGRARGAVRSNSR